MRTVDFERAQPRVDTPTRQASPHTRLSQPIVGLLRKNESARLLDFERRSSKSPHSARYLPPKTKVSYSLAGPSTTHPPHCEPYLQPLSKPPGSLSAFIAHNALWQ